MEIVKFSKVSAVWKRLGTIGCVLGISAVCASFSTVYAADYTSSSASAPKNQIVIRVGYGNVPNGPFDLGMRRWKEELEKISDNTMTLELYPSYSLGSKMQLIERMQRGEAIATLADGGTFYSMGSYNLGITFGPYLFKNWDEAFHLTASDWYKQEMEQLASKQGIHIIPGNWAYGVRHILTRKPVTKMSDFKDLTMRVTGNDVQEQGMQIFGAKTVSMDLTKVNAALRNGEVDGLENPLSHLYEGGYYKNARYLLLSSHIYNFTHMVVSEKFWQSLNGNQRQLLVNSSQRAARFFNMVRAADEYVTLNKMKREGVVITEPSPSFLGDLNNAAHSFYVLPTFTKKWSPSLFYKVLAAKSIPLNYYNSKRFKK